MAHVVIMMGSKSDEEKASETKLSSATVRATASKPPEPISHLIHNIFFANVCKLTQNDAEYNLLHFDAIALLAMKP